MKITLIPEPRDDVSSFRQVLRDQDIKYAEAAYVRDSVGDGITWLGEFSANPEVWTGAMGAISGWLIARQGRKVRVKFGDTEVEAGTVEEVERLLTLVEEKSPSRGEANHSEE